MMNQQLFIFTKILIRDDGMKKNKPNWKQIECSAFEADHTAGKLQPLPSDNWPTWGKRNHIKMNMYFTDLDREKKGDTGYLSTSDVNTEILMERYDKHMYKYYSYYYVELVDGRVFQIGPYTTNIPGGHHQLKRPEWLNTI